MVAEAEGAGTVETTGRDVDAAEDDDRCGGKAGDPGTTARTEEEWGIIDSILQKAAFVESSLSCVSLRQESGTVSPSRTQISCSTKTLGTMVSGKEDFTAGLQVC